MTTPATLAAAPPRGLEAVLEETWRDPPGLRGWLTTVDHKRIALRIIVTAFVAFALGGARRR